MTIHVDHEALEQVSDSLSRTAADVDALATQIPAEPDAGVGSGPLLVIVSRLLANAGLLVEGLSAAGSAVHEANSAYRGTDLETADRVALEQWAR